MFSSFAWGAVEVGAVFALSIFLGVEGFGFFDFVAEEDAGGDVGDVVVPGVAVYAREEFYFVAEVSCWLF